MTKQEILNIISLNGWLLSKDSAGDVFGNLTLDERVISVIPNLKNLRSGQVLSMRESVSTQEFSKAISYILGQKYSYHSLKTRFGPDFRSPKFSPKEILDLLEAIKIWGKEIDLSVELEVKKKLPTNSKGTFPLYHLAALALEKDLKTLEHYKRSFQTGDRLGFVPYITEEYISRALELGTT